MSTYIEATYDDSELTALKDKYGSGTGTPTEIFSAAIDTLVEQAQSSEVEAYDYSSTIDYASFTESNVATIEGTEVVVSPAGATSATIMETSY